MLQNENTKDIYLQKLNKMVQGKLFRNKISQENTLTRNESVKNIIQQKYGNATSPNMVNVLRMDDHLLELTTPEKINHKLMPKKKQVQLIEKQVYSLNRVESQKKILLKHKESQMLLNKGGQNDFSTQIAELQTRV